MTKAKKSLGQNFLVDGKVISEIINHVNPDSSDIFLEIGPGKGAITRELISKAGLTHAVEIDDILSKELSNFEDKGDFIVHHEDILNFDPSKLSHRQIRLIGNLPYNISTPIMFWSFKNINFFEDMHFMFQKEFGERLFAFEFLQQLIYPVPALRASLEAAIRLYHFLASIKYLQLLN